MQNERKNIILVSHKFQRDAKHANWLKINSINMVKGLYNLSEQIEAEARRNKASKHWMLPC